MSQWDKNDRAGGMYEQLGAERLVLARNWQGLIFQRSMRTTTGSVNYTEEQADLDKTLDELLTVLVDDGDEPPPAPDRR